MLLIYLQLIQLLLLNPGVPLVLDYLLILEDLSVPSDKLHLLHNLGQIFQDYQSLLYLLKAQVGQAVQADKCLFLHCVH